MLREPSKKANAPFAVMSGLPSSTSRALRPGGPFSGKAVYQRRTHKPDDWYILGDAGAKNGRSRPDTLTGGHGGKEYGDELGSEYFGVWRLGRMVL